MKSLYKHESLTITCIRLTYCNSHAYTSYRDIHIDSSIVPFKAYNIFQATMQMQHFKFSCA